MHSVRDLERGEGAALHAQNLFEELVDWYEPIRRCYFRSKINLETDSLYAQPLRFRRIS